MRLTRSKCSANEKSQGWLGKGFVKLHASSTAARRDWLGRARGFAPVACSLEHSEHESIRGAQNPRQAASEFFRLHGLAFPDGEDAPTKAAEGGGVAFVAGCVAFKFLSPPGALGLWDAGGFAVPVKMPEAAVDKNTDAVACQNDVGAPRQITPVETKTIAHGVEQAADDKFRLGILAANAGHQAAALLGGKGVGHDSGSCFRFCLDQVAVSLLDAAR